VLSNSKAVISIHNNNDKCFAYAILAVIHPTEKHPERVSKYLPYEHELNMKGKRYPVAIADIPKIERQNDISVNCKQDRQKWYVLCFGVVLDSNRFKFLIPQ
jgi:hypothetical protein